MRSVTTDLYENSDDLIYIAEGCEAHAEHLRRTENPYRLKDPRACLAWDLGWTMRQAKQFSKGLATADRRCERNVVEQLSRWITMMKSDNPADERYIQALSDFRDMMLHQGAYRRKTQ